MDGLVETSSLEKALGSERMLVPEAVTAMLRLKQLGWGIKRIAREMGCAKATVRRWVNAGGFVAYQRAQRPGVLAPLESWRSPSGSGAIAAMPTWFARNWRGAWHHGVLAHGGAGGGRTASGIGAPRPGRRSASRRRRASSCRSTSAPRGCDRRGGRSRASVRGDAGLLAADLRRGPSVMSARRHWLTGMESAFAHFGGVPREVLIDNARALVDRTTTAETREVDVQRALPCLCAVLEVQAAGLCAVPGAHQGQGRERRRLRQEATRSRDGASPSWEALDAHLVAWMRDIADARIHGTTGERPIDRFTRIEAASCSRWRGVRPIIRSGNCAARSTPRPRSRSTPTSTGALAPDRHERDGGDERRNGADRSSAGR